MPVLIPIIWSWISSGWVAFILPLIKKIPWQVWAAIAIIIGVLYYGHVREKRGYEKCHQQVVTATNAEEARRLEAANAALSEAQSRAQESARRAQDMEDANVDLQKQVGQLKTAKTVCLPKSITDQYSIGRMRRK